MATNTRENTLTLEAARRRIAETSFPREGQQGGAGKIGLEPECFPIRTDAEGRPTGRMALRGEGEILDTLDALAARNGMLEARPPDQPEP